MKKQYFLRIGGLAAVFLMSVLGGCASETETAAVTSKEIELLAPVGTAASYDVVQPRNLYDAEVYSLVCSPLVTEYAYETEAPFLEYSCFLGAQVSAGEVLVMGDMKQQQEEYEQEYEVLTDKRRDHEDAISELREDLYEATKDEYEVWAAYIENTNNKGAEGAYESARLAKEKLEQSILEKEELFAVEESYEQGKLDRLLAKTQSAKVIATAPGTVAAVNFYESQAVVAKNTNVIALAQTETKVLYTEYISKKTLEAAEDIYALIDGKRYEVTYQTLEPEEYIRQKKQNGNVHTLFYLKTGEDTVPFGKSVSLVLLHKSRKNVLAVLSDALYQEGQEYYCYVYDNASSSPVPVTVGMSDGLYTEILSGLSQGDQVLTKQAVSTKGRTQTLKKGSLSYEFLANGSLYYPSREWILNPAKNGETYFKEIYVEKYEQVQKGQALAKIEVITDTIETARLERKLQRQQERLDRLVLERQTSYSEDVIRELDRSIKSREKAIADLIEELEELTEYSGEVILTAPYDGIIIGLAGLEAEGKLSYKDKIVEIADPSESVIVVGDENGELSYGNEVSVSLMFGKEVEKEMSGTVISLNPSALSSDLQSFQAVIALSKEDMMQLAGYGSTVNSDGDWSRSRFEVRTKTRTVDNVVLVPQAAVKTEDKNTYVKIVDENGTPVYLPFIAGGLEQNYYWAAEGLHEGMEICLD